MPERMNTRCADLVSMLLVRDEGMRLGMRAGGGGWADVKVGRCNLIRVDSHVESSWFQRLNLNYSVEPPLNLVFDFNLRLYIKRHAWFAETDWSALNLGRVLDPLLCADQTRNSSRPTDPAYPPQAGLAVDPATGRYKWQSGAMDLTDEHDFADF